MRIALFAAALVVAAPVAAHAKPKLVFKRCNAKEKKKIKKAVRWLRNNFGKISRQMGKNGLMDWPGKSKKKLKKKLTRKKIKFRCIGDKKRCQPKKKKNGYYGQLKGRAVPILHQRRVALCTNALQGRGEYAAVIMHELAHLVRINAHRSKCKKRCRKPRFSESVEQATFAAYTGDPYDPSACAAACP